MSNVTIVPTLPLITLDLVSEVNSVADDMLLSAVKAEKIAKVPGGNPGQSRAFSSIGNVD